jgi:DNA-binding beta-propeller fold protein YncE
MAIGSLRRRVVASALIHLFRRSTLVSFRALLRTALLLTVATPLVAQAPVNDRPNPYTTQSGWAKLPAGRVWGSTSAVAIAKDGISVWVAERCAQNSCVGSDLDPILLFDANGDLVRSFGKGMVNWPHGIHVDRDGNVWIVDGRDNRPSTPRGAPAGTPAPAQPARVFGHQVLKFSPEGKLLMSLGTDGGAREPGYFWQPNAVHTAPNGDIFVVEGHSSADGATARLLKFDKTGKLVKTLGSKKGTGKDEFDQPHALAMDSRGRLFVADRSNNRIIIYDQNLNQLDVWTQFSRASGLFIDANDVLYAADSESGSIEPSRPEWLRGIRIGSARTGEVTGFIPDPDVNARSTSAAEGVAVDKNGVVYGAEVGPRALKRYVKK